MHGRKKITAAGLTLLLLAGTFTGCGQSSDLSGVPGHGKWVDSDVAGFVTAEDEIRLQDDFAAAANQEYITSVEFNPDEGETGPMMEAGNLVNARFRELLKDESITGANADALRACEDLVLNWEARNKLGVEPLRRYIDDIKSISSLDELTDWQGSTEHNPFNLGLMMPANVEAQVQYPDRSTLSIHAPKLSLGETSKYVVYDNDALKAREITDDTVTYFLERLGASPGEIKDVLAGNYRIETFLARNSCEDLYNAKETFTLVQNTRETLAEHAQGYPLLTILDSRGFGDCDSFSLDIMLLDSLPEIYTAENLSDLKSFLIVHTVTGAKNLMDRESMEKVYEIEKIGDDITPNAAFPNDDAIFASELGDIGIRPAMDGLYLEKYFPGDEKIARIEEIIDGIIDSYHQLLGEEDWLSEETRDAAVEKLDSMAIHAVRPDNTADYSKAGIKGYDEGGNLIDAAAEAHKVVYAHTAEVSANPSIDRYYWDVFELSTTTINCFYRPQANAFYILAGFLAVDDVLYGDEATYEQTAGCIGTVVGHEISHGFDAEGSKYDLYGRSYDENGNQTDWMTVEDRTQLDERADKLAGYFSFARPIPGKPKLNGSQVQNEAMADMAGIKATLYMARNIPDFDYDAFFRAYASLWAEQRTEEVELLQMERDEHPLEFYRINISLQQFDEFMDTYDVRPGDGMYMDPESLVSVW